MANCSDRAGRWLHPYIVARGRAVTRPQDAAPQKEARRARTAPLRAILGAPGGGAWWQSWAVDVAVRRAEGDDAAAIARIYVESWNAGFGDLMPPRVLDNAEI